MGRSSWTAARSRPRALARNERFGYRFPVSALTPKSKKDEIWREKQRLEDEARAAGRRAVVLERELDTLRNELERARERASFAEKVADELREQSERLALLTRFTRDLSSFDQEGVFRACLERIPYLVGARNASLYIYDSKKHHLVLKQKTHDRPIDTLVDLTLVPASLMAQAVRTRSLLLIDDLGSYRRDDGTELARPNKERYRTRSCIVAPLVAGDEVLGVINLADRFDESPFDKNTDLEVVQQAADLVAMSLRNSRLFEELQRSTRTDSLTGFLNHRATVERLDNEAKRARRYGHALALTIVDLDKFSLVNANYGHAAGDVVLEQSAKLIRGNVRDVDICGRTGGDELAVILPEQHLAGALVVAERLARIFADQRFRLGEVLVETRATVGVVQLAKDESASEALQRTKMAIEQARREGKTVGVKS
jgi:diguanylate cyclase (GGDEF)-like protein